MGTESPAPDAFYRNLMVRANGSPSTPRLRKRAAYCQPEKSLESWIWDAACSIRGAMACMNMIIHDMEGVIEIGDTFKNPKFRDRRGKLRTFDRVVANPMWNQDWFIETEARETDKALKEILEKIGV